MAEALVLTLIGKISSTLTEEAVKALYSKFRKELSILLEVEDKLKQIASEFKVMQAFLSQVPLGEQNQVVLETWLKEVREVAHDVEDTIDEYTYLIGKVRSSSDSFVKKLLHKSKNIVSFHGIATRLEKFEPRLKKLSDMKYRYEIVLPGESSSNFVGERQRPPVASPYLMDQEDLVGIGQERDTVVNWLKDVRNPARSIIVVWGMGGSGKTSLLHNIFDSKVMTGCFDFYVWITVSYKYQVVDILKRILNKDVNGRTLPETNSVDYMRNLQSAVRRSLEGKKYLIVLDDVWSKVPWTELDNMFPKGDRGSRIVMTSRNQEVAELARGRYVLELKCLGKEVAWDLFCRRAFGNEKESCPPALEEWARKIVSKCQGLPLSLVAIGSLLSYRAKEVSQWKRFYEQINWELSRKENIHELSYAARTLNLSYHYLPSYLKNCFLYCSIFPEDYLIEKPRIIRLWVAEGFICNEGRERKALEEVAEEYFNELIHRCLLQVVDRNVYGSVNYCRMHDIVRELTLTLSREQCFCMVVEDPKAMRSGDRARRLSVHEYNNDSLWGLNLLSLRTFISFRKGLNSASMPSSVLSHCKYMRVLDLEGIDLRRVPDCVVNLFNLHYLSLRDTVVEELPKSIGKLCNLQTLDLVGTPIMKLPRGVIELKNLRHLLVGGFVRRVEVPKGFWVLKDLQTLGCVKASNELVGRVGDLSQLRTFKIKEVRGVHCRELCASIAKMLCLYELEIRASGEETLRLEGLDGHQSLEELYLEGRLAEGVVPSFGSSLRYLNLTQSGIREDPLPSLSRLSNLVVLRLEEEAYDGQELSFRGGWFPNLKQLWIHGMEHLERVEIEEGALQSLEDLRLRGLKELKAVPIGIEFLTTLQQLYVSRANEELVEGIRGIDLPNIQIRVI